MYIQCIVHTSCVCTYMHYCTMYVLAGVPEVPIALPAPTLSQMPLTQFTQQPEHPPPVPPSQASSIASILAPDSQVSSQNSAHISQSSAQSMPKHLRREVSEEGSSSSTTSDVTAKINETVIHGTKSSHQEVCGKHTACVCVLVFQKG